MTCYQKTDLTLLHFEALIFMANNRKGFSVQGTTEGMKQRPRHLGLKKKKNCFEGRFYVKGSYHNKLKSLKEKNEFKQKSLFKGKCT